MLLEGQFVRFLSNAAAAVCKNKCFFLQKWRSPSSSSTPLLPTTEPLRGATSPSVVTVAAHDISPFVRFSSPLFPLFVECA